MSAASDLVARILAKREHWVDLEPGKRVRIRRPAESAIGGLRGGMTVEQIAATAVGWDGFTEADLVGASQGSNSVVAFDADLWATVLADRMDWAGIVAEKLVESITAHLEAREAARKN